MVRRNRGATALQYRAKALAIKDYQNFVRGRLFGETHRASIGKKSLLALRVVLQLFLTAMGKCGRGGSAT
jgi:hypothetical protein